MMTTEERDAISVRLTHILTACAYNDPVVGYCQGKLHLIIITSLHSVHFPLKPIPQGGFPLAQQTEALQCNAT